MADYLLIRLHDAFKKLQDSLNEANRVIAAGDLPVWLPEPFPKDRQLAADAITECWYQDDKEYPRSGLICVSPEHIPLFEKTNDLKQKFKEEIAVLKEATTDKNVKKGSLHKMIEAAGNGRDEEVNEALKLLRIARLNLLWCYRQILVLPPHLDSVSWTWATKHKSVHPLTIKEAEALVDKNINTDEDKANVKEILQAHQHQKLVQVKNVVPHLRANITYIEDGKKTRKMVTTPTVIISQDERIPRYQWRDCPPEDTERERLVRSDKRFNPEPIVRALGIYTYFEE